MKYVLLGGVFLVFLWGVLTPAVIVLNPPRVEVIEAHAAPAPKPDYSPEALRAYARHIAEQDGLNEDHFIRTIQCESQFAWNAVGDASTSIGIAQIHYPTRDWGIATSTAFDPYASIQIAANAWNLGQEKRWSCYNLLFGAGSG